MCDHNWDCKSYINEEGNYVTVCTCSKCGEQFVNVITPNIDPDDDD